MSALRYFIYGLFAVCVSFALASCQAVDIVEHDQGQQSCQNELVVLGIAQDAGKPQIGNMDDPAWKDKSLRRLATSLGLVDTKADRRWLFDATPDIKEQLYNLFQYHPSENQKALSGVFLTHAHIGHYTGLMFLGREAMSAKEVAVFGMPKMSAFLSSNGPWDLLVSNKNIVLTKLTNNEAIELSNSLQVLPIEVPHREEYSETVGYVISGKTKSVLFIPDIDSWEKLDARGVSIESLIEQVDIAYLDATFFSADELPGRNLKDIPHPTITHSMNRFVSLSPAAKRKIRFIHMNHSNPAIDTKSEEHQRVHALGFNIAKENERTCLD